VSKPPARFYRFGRATHSVKRTLTCSFFVVFVPAPILKQVEPEIAQLGEDVLSQQVFDWVSDAEKNQPYLRGSGRDAFGKPKSELVVTEGWRKLQEFGFERG